MTEHAHLGFWGGEQGWQLSRGMEERGQDVHCPGNSTGSAAVWQREGGLVASLSREQGPNTPDLAPASSASHLP